MRVVLLVAGVCAAVSAASTAAADVQLTMQGGRVTLVAKDVTVRQILAEWARVGRTTIVNAERIPGGPVTLELIDVPEQRALEVLLRSASGYLAAPRATTVATGSVFDRILVLPTSVPPPAATASTQPPPAFAQPSFPPPFPPVAGDERDDDGVAGVTGPPSNRGPVFAFPPPQVTTPPQGTPNAQFPQVVPQATAPAAFPPAVSYPGAPTATTPSGVAVPGMVVPTPAPAPQPGQPVVVFPDQQPQPQR
jgi:hypothetical protein